MGILEVKPLFFFCFAGFWGGPFFGRGVKLFFFWKGRGGVWGLGEVRGFAVWRVWRGDGGLRCAGLGGGCFLEV